MDPGKNAFSAVQRR